MIMNNARLESIMDYVTIIGLVAAVFTTVSLFPQIVDLEDKIDKGHFNWYVFAVLRWRVFMVYLRRFDWGYADYFC